MIQRIQTVYLAIAIVLLTIVTFGSTLFTFINETSRFSFSSYGIYQYNIETDAFVAKQFFPLFVGLIALILLCFLCIMSYKNVKRQFKIGRTIFSIYLIMLVSVVLMSTFGDTFLDVKTTRREMGLGFLLFTIGFPFTFLANIGIKRDKKLLDSLDRLR